MGYMQTCSYCKQPKSPLYKGACYKTKYGVTKYRYRCRDCNSRLTKNYYAICKDRVFDYYGRSCVCCGEIESMFLTIDHINNDGNKHRHPNGKRVVGVHLYSFLQKNKFPDGYQTLCMNCNFGKRMNNGICPHNNMSCDMIN